MRLNRLAAVSIAAAFTLGAVAVVPAIAGAQEEPPTTETTETTELPPVGPDVTINREFNVTCENELLPDPLEVSSRATTVIPEYARTGETVSFSTQYFLTIPEEFVALAKSVGLTEIPISNFNLSAVTSGGISGGPFSATPTSFVIPLPEVVGPATGSVAIAGNVTVTDETVRGDISLVNPSTMTITLPALQLVLDNTCTAGPDPTTFASINGEFEPPTTTTRPPTTTTVPRDVEADPNYTG